MITDFLQTKRSKDELKTALDVLRDFKGCESGAEWIAIPFVAWAKLEQLEEFLAHLVENKPLATDTLTYLYEQLGVENPSRPDTGTVPS